MDKILGEYKEKVPKPLNTKFPDRKSKDEAVADYTKKKAKPITLVPAGN